MKINTITPEESEYLQIVNSIAKPPKSFHYCGTLPSERRPTVAIVGTRKPTSYGKEVTRRLAHDLATRGVVIVSGLALGIDAIAHAAALEAGGATIAVLGNGLPDIYPATNAQLGEKIVAHGGALVSEYPLHEKARLHYFLERNRLVAGLSDAVIVTEAALRSGHVEYGRARYRTGQGCVRGARQHHQPAFCRLQCAHQARCLPADGGGRCAGSDRSDGRSRPSNKPAARPH